MEKIRYIDVTEAERTEHVFNGKDRITVLINRDELWFLASDVSRVLGLSERAQWHKLDRLQPEDRAFVNWTSKEGTRKVNLVSESGFYCMVMRSRKPVALPFQRWVTKEVLPSIRRTGGYTMANGSAANSDENKIVLPMPTSPVRYVVMAIPGRTPHIRETPIETILDELSSFEIEALCYAIKQIAVWMNRLQEIFSMELRESDIPDCFVMKDLERSVNQATELADRYLNLAKEMANKKNRPFSGRYDS
jgi:prophage antirepressor-like protein